MGFLFDKALDVTGKINDWIYYDHYGSTKNRSVTGSKVEAVSATVMATIAKVGGSDDTSKHHANRASQAAFKSIAKSFFK